MDLRPGWLADILGIFGIVNNDDEEMPQRSRLKFGAGFSVVDNPTTGRTDVSFDIDAGDDITGTPYTSFDPVAWPEGTHAQSDDFLDETASLAKWTLSNPGGNGALSFDEDLKRMILQATGTGGESAVFAAQLIPSSEFTI